MESGRSGSIRVADRRGVCLTSGGAARRSGFFDRSGSGRVRRRERLCFASWSAGGCTWRTTRSSCFTTGIAASARSGGAATRAERAGARLRVLSTIARHEAMISWRRVRGEGWNVGGVPPAFTGVSPRPSVARDEQGGGGTPPHAAIVLGAGCRRSACGDGAYVLAVQRAGRHRVAVYTRGRIGRAATARRWTGRSRCGAAVRSLHGGIRCGGTRVGTADGGTLRAFSKKRRRTCHVHHLAGMRFAGRVQADEDSGVADSAGVRVRAGEPVRLRGEAWQRDGAGKGARACRRRCPSEPRAAWRCGGGRQGRRCGGDEFIGTKESKTITRSSSGRTFT